MTRSPALDRALNRLAKWRSIYAGWQLGTQPASHGPTRAVRDHREVTLLMRAELNAVVGLLLDKGVFTTDEWVDRLTAEANWLNEQQAAKFPGMVATDNGISMDPVRSLMTMRDLGFPE